jgi:hypothetical protein
VRTLVNAILGSFALLAAPLAAVAEAQQRPGVAVEVGAGWTGFPDDGVVNESMVGGAARWYLLPRVSVGPELSYISGNSHSHLILTGNVTFDLLSLVNGRPRRITPFLIAGGGLFQTRQSFFSGNFTSTEGAFTAGGGIRAFATDRVSIGVDARLGWEPHLRLNGFVALHLGP